MTNRLSHGAAGVRRVVQDPPGVDAIERAVLERQGLGVGDHHLPLQAFQLETASDELNGMLGEVDPGRNRAGAHEANEVGPEAHADLEQAFFPRAAKSANRAM